MFTKLMFRPKTASVPIKASLNTNLNANVFKYSPRARSQYLPSVNTITPMRFTILPISRHFCTKEPEPELELEPETKLNINFKSIKNEMEKLIAGFYKNLPEHASQTDRILDDFLEIRTDIRILMIRYERMATRIHGSYTHFQNNSFNTDRALQLISKHLADLDKAIDELAAVVSNIEGYNLRYYGANKKRDFSDQILSCLKKIEMNIVIVEVDMLKLVKKIIDAFNNKSESKNLPDLASDLSKLMKDINNQATDNLSTISDIFSEVNKLTARIILVLTSETPDIPLAREFMREARALLSPLLSEVKTEIKMEVKGEEKK